MRRINSTLLAFAAVLGLSFNAFADEPVSVTATDSGPSLVGVTPMFDGMNAGAIEARMVLKNAMNGSLILKNLTDETINVSIPEAFGAQQILGQFGGGGGFGAGGGQQGGGGAQTAGGGAGGQQGGGDTGAGFFSIAPQKVKSVKFNSVCLEHGKKEPSAIMKYKPVPLEEVASTGAEEQFLLGVSLSGHSTEAMQAAAWHLFNDMSWSELANKKRHHANRPDTPYFTAADLRAAQQIVAISIERARKAEQQENRL